MYPGLEWLKVVRVTRIIQGLSDKRELPQELVYLRRAAVTPAMDGEIMGRSLARALIAPLIAYDATAPVYSTGRITFETTIAPKIKIGAKFNEEQIKQFFDLVERLGPVSGEGRMLDFLGPFIQNIILGVRQRLEFLLVAMHTNVLNYDRMGFKLSSGGWGWPTDLQVTLATPWNVAASATPIDNILAAILTAKIRYGKMINRVRMSTPAFRLAQATAEFQAKAKVLLASNINFGNISSYDLTTNMKFFEALTNCTIETYDARYWEEDQAGVKTSAAFQGLGKVILDNTENDNRPDVYDLSDGVVPESMMVGRMPTGVVGAEGLNLGQGVRGPYGYTTFSQDLNPPAMTIWGASVNFPRRMQLEMNMVLDVGAVADTIPIGDPFSSNI